MRLVVSPLLMRSWTNHPPLKLSTELPICAFALVELLVVIAVIGILASLMTVAAGQLREHSRTAQCISNLRQLAVAITTYAHEQNGDLPAPAAHNDYPVWHKAIGRGDTLPLGLFVCPSQTARYGTSQEAQTYAMNGRIGPGSQHSVTQQSGITRPIQSIRPSRTLLLMDSAKNPSGGTYFAAVFPQGNARPAAVHKEGVHCLFLDSSVEFLTMSKIPTTTTTPEARLFWFGTE